MLCCRPQVSCMGMVLQLWHAKLKRTKFYSVGFLARYNNENLHLRKFPAIRYVNMLHQSSGVFDVKYYNDVPQYSFFTQYILFCISQDNRNLMSFYEIAIFNCCIVQGYVYMPTNSPSIVSLLCNKFRSRLSEELTVSTNRQSNQEFPTLQPDWAICLHVCKSFTLATLAPGSSSPFSFHVFSILFFGKCFACFGNPWMLTLPPLDCFIFHQSKFLANTS